MAIYININGRYGNISARTIFSGTLEENNSTLITHDWLFPVHLFLRRFRGQLSSCLCNSILWVAEWPSIHQPIEGISGPRLLTTIHNRLHFKISLPKKRFFWPHPTLSYSSYCMYSGFRSKGLIQICSIQSGMDHKTSYARWGSNAGMSYTTKKKKHQLMRTNGETSMQIGGQ